MEKMNLIEVLGEDGVARTVDRFDYGQLSSEAAAAARQAGHDLDSLQGSFYKVMNQARDKAGEILANVREVMDKEKKGLFFQWAEQERGLKYSTVLNLLDYHKGISQNFESREQLYALPASLVYALGKEGTPANVKQGILSGAITSVKDMKQASAGGLLDDLSEEEKVVIDEAAKKLSKINQNMIEGLCREFEEVEEILQRARAEREQQGFEVPENRELQKSVLPRAFGYSRGRYDLLAEIYKRVKAGEVISRNDFKEMAERLYPEYWNETYSAIDYWVDRAISGEPIAEFSLAYGFWAECKDTDKKELIDYFNQNYDVAIRGIHDTFMAIAILLQRVREYHKQTGFDDSIYSNRELIKVVFHRDLKPYDIANAIFERVEQGQNVTMQDYEELTKDAGTSWIYGLGYIMDDMLDYMRG